jgi:flagellar basal-body rod modification protein FlgD
MAQVPSLLNTSSIDQPFGQQSVLDDLDLDVFLKLMITELQNQDPLNPLDNSEMLAQINQIREIGATDKLTGTLNSVLLGQNIASATNLIGKDVRAIADNGDPVTGTVSRVLFEEGKPKVQVDLAMTAEPSIEAGELEKGTYSYRIIWEGEDGALEGIELDEDDAISTVHDINDYQSIQLSNLPVTEGLKQIYRTDSSGEGDYRLVATLANGSQESYLDTASDEARYEKQLEKFKQDASFRFRSFKVGLDNIGEIFASGS